MGSDLAFIVSLLTAFASYFLWFFIIILIIGLICIVSLWRIFTKAGKEGWIAIVPFYNFYVLVQIARLPWWYFLAIFVGVIPVIGGIISLVATVIIAYNLAKQFGKDIGYTLGLIFLPFIFYPMLAFGDSVYKTDEEVFASSDQTPSSQPESVQNTTPEASASPATDQQPAEQTPQGGQV